MHKSFRFGAAPGNIPPKIVPLFSSAKSFNLSGMKGIQGITAKTTAYLVIQRTKPDYLILSFYPVYPAYPCKNVFGFFCSISHAAQGVRY